MTAAVGASAGRASWAPRAVDLFCGAGGLAEGFRQAGFEVIAGNDSDPDACATFAANFPEARAIYGSIRDKRVREQLLEVARGADIVVGGPPCQGFSQVRNHSRLMDDPRNSLYREFVRAVERLRPLAVVMENVPGLQQMGAKEQVLQDLALDGEYRVAAQLLDAADFGVPQTRKRLVFIGLHRSLGAEPPVLQGTGATLDLALVRRADGRRTLVSCKWSVRSDREEQFATDFAAYARLEAAGRDFGYVLVTNEFDPARLAAACGNRRENALLFSAVVHVNPDGPRAAYRAPVPHRGTGISRALAYADSGRLSSLATWLSDLATPLAQ